MKNFGLSKNERIKKAKDFKKIYLEGKVVFSDDGYLKATFLIKTCRDNPVVKVSAAVSRKTGKAVCSTEIPIERLRPWARPISP